MVGTGVILACIGEEVEDSPLTIVSWEFNGKRLFNSSDHYITNDFFTIKQGSTPKVRTNLSVLNVRFADGGNYSCILNTDRVTDERDSITLEVKAKGMKLIHGVIIP